MNFQFSKWYFDCVSDDGTAFIGYLAAVKYGPIKLNYTAWILHENGTTTEKSDFSIGEPHPQVTDSKIIWNGSLWSGTWSGEVSETARKHRLHETSEGIVDWNCLLPLGQATVQINGRTITGKGYAERLDSNLQPWKLPIDTLHWGRFIADNESLVWIRWEGSKPLALVLKNGRQIAPSEITAEKVMGLNTELPIERISTIRDGALSKSLLNITPILRQMAPVKALETIETKWLSKGELNGSSKSGWCVHEVVHFPA